MHRFLLVFALAGLPSCADQQPDPAIVGPFVGAPHRFVVDSITYPSNTTQAGQIAEDLDGDHAVDNEFGAIIGTLLSEGDGATNLGDLIASGVLASSIVIDSDDLANDDRAGLAYFGADGDTALPFGGQIVDGVVASNRAGSSAPGAATIRLPIFDDVAPLELHTRSLELDLTPDGAGYRGVVRGGFEDVLPVVAAGMNAMLTADPNHHLILARGFDSNGDGTITDAEIAATPLVTGFTTPDITLRGERVLSFAFQIHLSPCATGTCVTAPPADHCDDGVLDGDETAIDCGGACDACPGASTCAIDADCQTATCGADLTCAAPSCTDGVVDGFESDLDCGGTGCPACALHAHCIFDADCLSGRCDGTTSTCVE